MSHPFFIWTLRRTGGTSLTDLLMALSEHKPTQHEPFLFDRVYGGLSKRFEKDGPEAIRGELRNIFEERTLIKHCYETLWRSLNDTFFEVLQDFPDYRHILLLRRDETARMLSLLLAYQTDVWGKHGSESVYEAIRSGKRALHPFDLDLLRKEEMRAIQETEHIRQLLADRNINYHTVYFEDLYEGERSDRMAALERIFEFLEFDRAAVEKESEKIAHILFNRSQQSQNILDYVPNVAEVREILDSFPGRETITGGQERQMNEPIKKNLQKLTLYLGAHKTATTHLQGILHANRQRLSEHGIKLTMPGDVRKEWLPAFFHWCNHKDTESKRTMDRQAPTEGTWLLTEENIAGVSNDFTRLPGIYPKIDKRLSCLREAYPEVEMELFFSLRSYETFYRSAYSEVVRNRGYLPFDEFYDEERFRGNSWLEMVRRIAQVIPQERITLWRYEDFRTLVPEILRRMTGVEDTEAMIAAYHAETTRPSLSQKTIDILDALHPVLDRQESKKLVERINHAYPVGEGHAPLRTFTPEQEGRFRLQYQEDVEAIRSKFPKINFLGVDHE